MRCVLLAVLLLFTSALTACSYVTDFVVINESAQPIEVTCKYKPLPGERHFEPYIPLAKISADRLRARGGNEWQELTPSQYALDRESRTATVRLMPGEALRVNRIHGYDGHEASRVSEYLVEEISAAGVNGRFMYTGRMTLTSFSEVSRVLYTLTYK